MLFAIYQLNDRLRGRQRPLLPPTTVARGYCGQQHSQTRTTLKSVLACNFCSFVVTVLETVWILPHTKSSSTNFADIDWFVETQKPYDWLKIFLKLVLLWEFTMNLNRLKTHVPFAWKCSTLSLSGRHIGFSTLRSYTPVVSNRHSMSLNSDSCYIYCEPF